MQKYPGVRTVYLYLVSLAGLILLTIGVSMIINLLLKIYVFTKADIRDNYISQPIPLTLEDPTRKEVEGIQACSDKCELTEQQKKLIAAWLEDYDNWSKIINEKPQVDYVTSDRQRQAATAISLIMVGLPLWLYHWRIIRKEVKKMKDA